MQKPNQPVLTNAGRQMLNDVAGSKGKITYTKAVMYGQDLSSMTIDQLRDLTTINDSKLETKIGVSDIKLETVTIIASFSNATVMQDTTYSSIGWYASTTVDSAEKLIAVIPYQQPQTLIAGSNGKATASTDIQLLFHIGDDVNVELRPIEEGLISAAELKNALTLLSSKGLFELGDIVKESQIDYVDTTSIKWFQGGITIQDFVTGKFTSLQNATGFLITMVEPDYLTKRQFLLSNNTVYTRQTYSGNWGSWSPASSYYISNSIPRDISLAKVAHFPTGTVIQDKGSSLVAAFVNQKLLIDKNDFLSELASTTNLSNSDNVLINHMRLMTELAPYGKVKSVNGIAPDTTGNVDVMPQHFRFNNNEMLDLPLTYDKNNKSVNLDISSLLSLISFDGGTVDPAIYSTVDPKLYDNLLISHREFENLLAGYNLVKSVNGIQPDSSGNVTLDIKGEIDNAPFVKTDPSVSVTLNPGVTSTGKTLIYKSPTGNPSDDVYLATQNDLNQKVDKSSVYSKAETNTAIEKAKPTNIAFNTTGSETDRMGDLVPIKYDFNNIPHINLTPLAKYLTEVFLDHPELVHAIGLDAKADKSNVYSKDEAIKTFGKVKTVDSITPDSNGNVLLNAVRGTGRSRKQLEINPSVTIGSDRTGYMIRDGSDSFNLASTNDLDNKISKYVIKNESDLSKYNLTDLNSLLRIPEGIYVSGNGSALFHNIENIPSGLYPSQNMIIKIMDLEDNSKTQIQVIDVFNDTEIDTYKRMRYINGNAWTSTSWYKFSGTKVN